MSQTSYANRWAARMARDLCYNGKGSWIYKEQKDVHPN